MCHQPAGPGPHLQEGAAHGVQQPEVQLHVLIEVQLPHQLAVRQGQALAQVGFPFRGGVGKAVALCGQAARERLQVLQRVADVVLHLPVGRLVHQREQPRADVVVQVLGDAPALGVLRVQQGLRPTLALGGQRGVDLVVQQGQHAATQRGDDDGLLAEARGQAQLSAGCATSAPRGRWAG